MYLIYVGHRVLRLSHGQSCLAEGKFDTPAVFAFKLGGGAL